MRTVRVVPAWAFALLAAFLLVPTLVHRPASAAQLHVTAAPIQTWRIDHGLPELPDLGVDLSACGDVESYDEIVVGTADDDVLEAGNGRNVLVGLAGDDLISGGNHDDCLLGGAGDDTLKGGNGKDVLVGGRGADELDGGNAKDRLDAGGDIGDSCVDSNGADELIGCEGPVEPAALQADTSTETADPATTGTGRPSGTPSGQSGPAKEDPSPQQSSGGSSGSGTENPGSGQAPDDTAAPTPPPAVEQPADETQVTVP